VPRIVSRSRSTLARLLGVALGLIVTVGTDPRARAGEPTPTTTTATAAPTTKKAAEPSSWRGSEIAYRNSATAISFDRSAELTWNPTWVMALELAPRYWLSETVSLGASLELSRELTNADDTTQRGETLIGDLALRISASKLATLPGDIVLGAGFGLTLPTSLASQGDTLIMSIAPSLRLSRTFDKVLDGLTIGYGLRFTKLFHAYTTGALDEPLIATCFGGSAGSCDRFLNTGGRNVSFRMSNGLDVSLGITEWLSASVDLAVVVSWLYGAVEDARVSTTTLEPTDTRYALVADLGVSARPWKPLEIRLGAATINPQLAPDGSRYAPFFNRFTNLYLDLRLDVAELVADLAAPATQENRP